MTCIQVFNDYLNGWSLQQDGLESYSGNSACVCVCVCVGVWVGVWVGGWVCVGVGVEGCGRVWVCVFISFHRKGLSWLNKTNVVPEVQVSDGMMRKYLYQVPLSHVIDNHNRNVQAGNCAKLSKGRATRSIAALTVKARSIATFFTNLGSRSDAA